MTKKVKGANVDEKDDDGNTPLHIAALECSFDDIISLLIRHNTSPYEKNNKGETFLDLLDEEYRQRYIDLINEQETLYIKTPCE